MAKTKTRKKRATGNSPRRKAKRGGGGKSRKKVVRGVRSKRKRSDVTIPDIPDPVLDMEDGRDRRDLRAACAREWLDPTADQLKLSEYTSGLDRAFRSALPKTKTKVLVKDEIRSVNSCVKTRLSIQRMIQIEELTNLGYDRIDAGKATARVELTAEDDARLNRVARILDGYDEDE